MTDPNAPAPAPGPAFNQAQFLSAVRWIISVGGGYALGHGWINNQQLVDIGGVAAALVPLIWSMAVHSGPKA